MRGSFQNKGASRGHSWAAFAGGVAVVLSGIVACGGGDGDTTTDEPVLEGVGGFAGASDGSSAGGSADGGSGGSSSGGAGGTSTGGAGGSSLGGSGGSSLGGAGGSSAGGSGGTSSGGAGGTAGVGGAGGVCDQVDWEPNDSESTARPLTDITDCDDEGGALDGTLSPGDVDWYSFNASDSLACSVNPYIRVTSADNVTVCMFFQCAKGNAEVTCPSGSQDWSSNPSHPGCCSSLTPMEPTVNCSGTLDEGVQMWLQVSWLGNTNCRPYSLEYHY